MKSKLAISSFVLALIFLISYFLGSIDEIGWLVIVAYLLGVSSLVSAVASLILMETKWKDVEGKSFAISALIMLFLWFLYIMFGLLRLLDVYFIAPII